MCQKQNHPAEVPAFNTLTLSGGRIRHLDVLLESRVDDYLNVDGDRDPSEAWHQYFYALHDTE